MSCVRDCSNLPKWYTNTPASIVIGLGSARSSNVPQSLENLASSGKCALRIDHNEAVSSRTLASLSDDLDSICLIRECRDLDNYFLSDFTSVILQREVDTCPIQAVINEEILSKDRKLRLAKHEGRPDLSVVVEVYWMAQTMGSCTRPGTKLHSWPQELCTDSYLSTPCHFAVPTV